MKPAGAPDAPGGSADRALVARCRAGDLTAFDAIYRQHAGRLYNVVARMVGRQGEAEDLLQEVFLTAFRKLESFRGDSALGTWLYRLATNVCLDYLRSRAGRTQQVTDGFDDQPIPDARTRGLADSAVSRVDLERALEQLPDGCRAAFVLHDIEGLEHREVAEALGIAEGTSKSQVHKARLRLRALLAPRGARE